MPRDMGHVGAAYSVVEMHSFDASYSIGAVYSVGV